MWEARLQQPGMTPDQLLAHVSDVTTILEDNFFLQSGLAFIRDAYTAAKFAKQRGAQSVRLCAGTRPDFEMTLDGITQLFEVTEADLPGRTRGKEYRDALGQPPKLVHVEQLEMFQNACAIPGALEDRATLKAGKSYDPSWSLVILLNIPTYGVAIAEVESIMTAATEAAGKAFSEVWVMWNGRLYRPWPAGWNAPPEPAADPSDSRGLQAWLDEQGG